jgi:hypothetical protein
MQQGSSLGALHKPTKSLASNCFLNPADRVNACAIKNQSALLTDAPKKAAGLAGGFTMQTDFNVLA